MISFAKMMKQVLTETMTFQQLMDTGGTNIPYVLEPTSDRVKRSGTVNARSLRVMATDTGEAWTFRYKSNPSSTGQPWHGFIQFFKENVGEDSDKSASEYECMVDCDCPDYRYRFAYNNARSGAGTTGRQSGTGWKYHNTNNGAAPKSVADGGVGDYGPGLCKHLCALGKFLETKVSSKAPDPKDKVPPTAQKKEPPKKEPPVSQKPPTTAAPKPEDTYSDSRAGSDTLQEQFISPKTMSEFVRINPEFDVYYEEPDQQINEATVVHEAHDRGEWWIDETGETVFADGNVGDQNHEAVVINFLAHQILSHFGIDTDEPGELSGYEETIKENLLADGRLDEEELATWDNMGSAKVKGGPAVILIKKLIEDKAFEDPKQAEDAVFIAYGSSSRDARDYAMKYWRWKVMKTEGGDIEIQSWHLKPEDLGIIVRGIWEIMTDSDPDDDEDSDNEVGEDGYPGPRVNVTVQASGKRFHDIPLAVLEKKMPQNLHNYQSGVHVGYTEQIHEEFHHLHKEYRLYEGNRHIIALFEDGTRLKFEVHFRNNRGPDKEKWRHRAFTTWKSCASEIHKESQELNEVGNPMTKPWRQCFKEALKHPRLQEFIRHSPHHRVFGGKEVAPIYDPVNFTQMG